MGTHCRSSVAASFAVRRQCWGGRVCPWALVVRGRSSFVGGGSSSSSMRGHRRRVWVSSSVRGHRRPCMGRRRAWGAVVHGGLVVVRVRSWVVVVCGRLSFVRGWGDRRCPWALVVRGRSSFVGGGGRWWWCGCGVPFVVEKVAVDVAYPDGHATSAIWWWRRLLGATAVSSSASVCELSWWCVVVVEHGGGVVVPRRGVVGVRRRENRRRRGTPGWGVPRQPFGGGAVCWAPPSLSLSSS